MTRRSPLRPKDGPIIPVLALFVAGNLMSPAFAEDWGAYALVPASAPSLVLEAVDSGTTDGTVVSIGRPTGTANQKWVVTSKGNNLYSIRPSYSSTLVLAVAQGGVKMGTPIVLETDKGQPWQEWTLKKSEHGSYG